MHPKTMLFHNTKMLQHKTKKKHPQKAARLSSILKYLQEGKYFQHPQIISINNTQRYATNEDIQLVYKPSYIDYIQSLWPKNSHRTSITVLDTYFCQHSQMAARLAIGHVLEAIDRICNGDIKTAFAIVRPPGHHSGHHSTINGFCVFNNLAIGINYLRKNKGKAKIAVVDWDVHHGDGTQHIFNEDQNILFISIHRHDDGAFYPAGDFGHFTSCGEEAGKGRKLNFSINKVQGEIPGDNEYIYLFQRAILPILQEFDPSFIFISCGFDAARNDPLGGFGVTPDGYQSMTRMLTELKKPVLVVLEGGYNLKEIPLAAEAVVQGLLLYPPQTNIINQAFIPSCYHDQFDQIIEFFSKYWPILLSNKLVDYEQKIKSNTKKKFGLLYDHQTSSSSEEEIEQNEQKGQKKQKDLKEQTVNQFCFAAGHMQRFKNFSFKNKELYKWSYDSQIKFYQSNFQQKQFAPKYSGKEDQYIIIQNLLFNQKNHVVLDIKLSRLSKNPHNSEQKALKEQQKQKMSTSEKYSFRIGGFTTPTYKEGGIMISDEKVILKLLGKVVKPSNISQYETFIQSMIDCLSKVNRKYYGTSIVMVSGDIGSTIKWIDFHYWYQDCESCDKDLIQGLENLLVFIKKLNLSQQS